MTDVVVRALIGTAALVLAVGAPRAVAQSDSRALSADQVAAALKGKVCTTKGGARFTFAPDGHYAYAGLGMTHTGHYRSGEGVVTVLLDSGLGRSFAISSRDSVLYMEQTAVGCAPIAKESVSLSATH